MYSVRYEGAILDTKVVLDMKKSCQIVGSQMHARGMSKRKQNEHCVRQDLMLTSMLDCCYLTSCCKFARTHAHTHTHTHAHANTRTHAHTHPTRTPDSSWRGARSSGYVMACINMTASSRQAFQLTNQDSM